MTNRKLFLDVETYSSVDIGKCGAYKYVESDDFEILLIGYAYDDEPVRVIDCTDEYVPDWLREDMFDPRITKIAWNAAFERTCFSKFYGQYTHPSQWLDPMIISASCGLPLSLAQAGEALGLGEDKAKMKVGKDLIRYFCLPCKPTRTNGQRTRNLPEHAEDKWNTFIEYNIRDVEVERTIFNMLKPWTLSYKERKLWALDQQINDRGMRIDVDLATKAIEMATEYKNGLIEQAAEISGLENPNSASQVKQWLSEQEDIEVVSLNKKEVADLVAGMTSETAKKFMELRSEFSQSSISKYDSALRCTGTDEHIHGCFQYYGAGTGRWSGRLLQMQNLSHDTIPDLDAARVLAKIGDYEDFKATYPNVQYVLKCLIRTLLIPEKDSRFIVADFSAIEARVTAWIAGEQWRIKTFENNGDIYCESASQAFKVPVVKHGINGHLRQKGKVLELACIAHGEEVLTNQGLVPIQDVTTDMRVWDGYMWVEHDGVVYRGMKEVITYQGLTATPDHLVYVTEENVPIHFGTAAKYGLHLLSVPCYERPIIGEVRPQRYLLSERPELIDLPDEKNEYYPFFMREHCSYYRERKEDNSGRVAKIVRVYDILNAGPHHRFTVSKKLVHNCGYGGGIGAMKNFGADKLGMSEEEMADTVAKWREASPRVVNLWSAIEKAATKCVKTKKHQDVNCAQPVSFDYEGNILFMTLPSKRRIAYYGADIGEDKWGRPSLSYYTMTMKHKWERVETWGGKLTENCVQATSRDVLAEAMFHLDDAGYDIRGHVHDEIIMTVPNGKGSLEEAIKLMCLGNTWDGWTKGLPLNADGFENSISYRKD